MTDKEIIKALGVCISALDCTECPYTNVLKRSIERDALDLINRQQAEIERLQEYYKRYFDRNRTINELQENIEHLQGKIDMYEEERKYHFEMSKKAQAEAIKEFAERLKDAFPFGDRNNKCSAIYYDFYCEIIDQTAEEMTEKKKG